MAAVGSSGTGPRGAQWGPRDALAIALASRGSRLSPTAVCLTEDDGTAYSVAKDGSILCWDMATLSRKRFPAPNASLLRSAASDVASAAYWVQPAARRGGSRTGLLACSVSSDGRYLAVGGGSNQVRGGASGTHACAHCRGPVKEQPKQQASD